MCPSVLGGVLVIYRKIPPALMMHRTGMQPACISQYQHADKDEDKRPHEKIASLDCEVGSDVARWHDWFPSHIGDDRYSRPEIRRYSHGIGKSLFVWHCVVGLRGRELPTKRLSAASFGGNPEIPRKSRDVRCWPVLRVVNFGQTHSPSVGTIHTPKNRAVFGSGRSQTRSKRPKTRFWLWHENSARSTNSDRRQKW
jgi:hypothetical protein